MSWTVPKIWEGSTCVIIGGGPSLLKQFDIPDSLKNAVYTGVEKPSAYSPYLEPLHKMHVIAVNVAYMFGDWIDIMFFGDHSTWNEQKENLRQFKGLVVTCDPEIENTKRVRYIARDHKKRRGITTDPSKLSWNNNSGSAAINFAVHLGVKRIILLGFDMKLDADQNQHWHKFYKTGLKQVDSTMRKHLSCFPEIKKDLDLLGIEVINANPDSGIGCFTKMNFKNIIL